MTRRTPLRTPAPPLFSVCIPNFNYARYLRVTLESVLQQSESDFEIIVADNASTDDSVAVVASFDDPRIVLVRNAINVGFAANIDRACEPARGRFRIVLSSDDIMLPGALARYRDILLAQPDPDACVLTSAVDIIDSDGKHTAVQQRAPGELFYQEVAADTPAHADVVITAGYDALRASLLNKNTPTMFLATCYSGKLFHAVCGYRSGYRMWPDSHFLNKLLSVAGTRLVYVPDRLFGYRIHNNNQMSQELGRGALKYHLDAYLHTLEFPEPVLQQLGLTRDDLVKVFIEKAVMERGLQALAAGSRLRALRLLMFGLATYPEASLREKKTAALIGLLGLGPLASVVTKQIGNIARRARS
jgi:glycosyltransferase involved in cell wall biosynthesis